MRLRVTTPSRTFEYAAPPGKASFVIGNRKQDDVCIDDDPAVSGPHVRIERTLDKWTFTDQMSDSGTMHQGERKATGDLSVGDVLLLGNSRIEVLAPEAIAAAPVAPASNAPTLEQRMFEALRDAGEHDGAFSFLDENEREAEYRKLARKALEKGPHERVEFVWLPLLREGEENVYDIESDLNFDIDDPMEDLGKEEIEVVDFIVKEFRQRSGIELRKDPFSLQRVGDESDWVADELKKKGESEIRLPYLGALKEGPHHFCAKLEFKGGRIAVKQWLDHVPAPKTFKPRPPEPQRILVKRIVERFKEETGIDLKPDHAAMDRLRTAAKTACEEFRTKDRVRIDLPFISAYSATPVHLNMEVARTALGEAAAALTAKPDLKPEPAVKKDSLGQQVFQWLLAIAIIVLVLIAMYVLDL
jgi:Hsp70 protein/FHA domain